MIDLNMILVGSRIKELRQDLGLTQLELAHKIGIAQNTIAQYEKGISKMSLEVLVSLVVELKTSADYLLGL